MIQTARAGRASASALDQTMFGPPTSPLPADALLVNRPAVVDAWVERIDDLLRMYRMEHDWDGDGALAPRVELIDSALRLSQQLRRQGYDVPSRVVAGVNGTILFEWQCGDVYEEIEVTEPFKAEAMRITPGRPAEHWIIAEG